MLTVETITQVAKEKTETIFPDADEDVKEFSESLLRLGMHIGANLELDTKIAKHERTKGWLTLSIGLNLLYALLFIYMGT